MKDIRPVYKFFIVTRLYSFPCEVVDFDALSNDAAVDDFSQGEGLTRDMVTVIHKRDGTFENVYRSSS